MIKYTAFLRGIMPTNPNMRNEKLREVFEDLGFENVRTVIASGNVLFDLPAGRQEVNTKKLEKMIQEELKKQLGFFSTTIVKSKKDLEKLINKNLFQGLKDLPTSRFNVTFLKNPPHTDLKSPFVAEEKGYKVLGIQDRTVFSVIDLSGAKTPDVMLWLEKQFGKEITTRTWKTVNRIVSKL